MTKIPTPVFIVHEGGYHWVAPGAPEERCVLGPEVRDLLPTGTVTIDADECYAVAAGGGGFYLDEQEGVHLGDENVTPPAYIIAGPGLPALIPGGGAVLTSQAEADLVPHEFYAIDANGSLFMWAAVWEEFGTFAWEKTGGYPGPTTPTFPITSWQMS
jgi:hypothetical protein